METKKIVPVEIIPKEVNTKNGKKTLYEVKADDGDVYTCWDTNYAQALNTGEEVEITFETTQNGRYTSRTIFTPRKRKYLTAEDVEKIVTTAVNNSNAKIMSELENIKQLINLDK